MSRRYQTLADYAALAIAPALIWWLLNSLANFLMLVLYHGNYSQRGAWTLMCYTMGATALARVTIEESREKASVYAVCLGAATFFVMTKFLKDPVFTLAVILTIGYLADRIVHDCTIIDDGVDSSGRGLIDNARKWFQQRSPPSVAGPAPSTGWQPRSSNRRAGHQPGMTVLYLAIGALPLFGIGQFFLNNDPNIWQRAKWYLSLYLFTSLSLLVVTSFLNLRRYLRQRGTEMSTQVTIAWLAGGVGMIFLILLLAFLAPMPGQTLIATRLPDFLTDSDSTKASRLGWGEEGADLAGENAPTTGAPRPDAQKPEGAPQITSPDQPDAEPGGDRGNRDDGPAGKDKGGTKPAGSDESPDQPGKSESAASPSDSDSGSDADQSSESDPSESAQSSSEQSSESNSSDESTQPNDESSSPESNDPQSPENNPADEPSDADPSDPDSADPNSTDPDSAEPDPADSPPPETAASPSTPPTSTTDWSGALTGMLKFLLFVILLIIVAVYVYLYREAWLAWLHSWLNGGDNIEPVTPTRRKRKSLEPAGRPFSSFANPVGGVDAGEVVVVTFQALEAWGREQGVQRGEDETPSEFVRRLANQFPTLKQPAWRVVDAYNRVVYGRAAANRGDVTAASSVWEIMRPQL
ncbi:DUF4129 domain-containing protein [Allorhodopirellula solitaria]|uniref:Protein-glutamine gamma-glutamyltransferase-like C-terminal domain-containing protein n=1 Tax=Allorhodopirellula solitaria TaxID=2527987 RepID=A0A5C5YEX8_9BACT|nr:DUF4129 domain-containing protein [Allorhodopirellula solitaria]TWT74286.1 hypothetical protein CA85_11730 [Allorhodopirellula solitaria]